jgi:hypothetical protein
MAKSIYSILEDLRTETSVPDHGMVEHTLPAELLPTAEEFEDSEKLKEWAEANAITHAVLQKGVQKFLIDLRATFKACKKDETWTVEKGQEAVNKASWDITKRPKVGKSDEAIAMEYLASLDEKARKELLKNLKG